MGKKYTLEMTGKELLFVWASVRSLDKKFKIANEEKEVTNSVLKKMDKIIAEAGGDND